MSFGSQHGFDVDLEEVGIWSERIDGVYRAWKATAVSAKSPLPEWSPAVDQDRYLSESRPAWGNFEASRVGFDAVQAIDAAARHALGIKALLDERLLTIAPNVLLRSLVEHVAHAGWLLEPEISPEARVARFWMARLAAACRFRHLASSRRFSRGKQGEAKKVREAVKKEVLTRFPGVDLRWDDPGNQPMPTWNLEGEIYPGLNAQCKQLFRWVGLHGDTHGIYDLLSFLVHPNPVYLSMAVGEVDTGEGIEYRYRSDPELWEPGLELACLLIYRGGQAACSYLGLDDAHLERWVESYFSHKVID